MKQKLLLTLTALVGLSSAAYADRILIDSKVTLRKEGQVFLKAYRKLDNCHSWLYHPGHYTTTGQPLIMKRPVRIPLINDENQTAQNKMGMVANINFQIKSPTITHADENELKSIIMKEVNGSIGNTEPNNIYKDCTRLNMNNISLNVASVAAIGANKTETTHDNLDSIRSEIKLMGGYGSYSGMEINTLGTFPISFRVDASNPSAKNTIQKEFSERGRSLGTLGLAIDAVSKSINSSITVRNTVSAVFKTTSIPTCKSKRKRSSASGAIISTFGAVIGSTNTSSQTRKCEDLVTTSLKAAFSNGHISIEHKLPLKGRTYVEIDENGEAKTYPLNQWVEEKLLSMWIDANFDIISTKISDGVFENKLGRKGSSTGNMSFHVSLNQSDIKEEGIDAKVLIGDIDMELLSFRRLQDEITRCINDSYFTQFELFMNQISSDQFIPVDMSCFKNIED